MTKNIAVDEKRKKTQRKQNLTLCNSILILRHIYFTKYQHNERSDDVKLLTN